MLKKILNKFDYVKNLNNQISQLKDEQLILRAKLISLEHLEAEKPKEIIDIEIGDPTPTDSEARKIYVATVAGFFKNIMEPKLKYMLSYLHNRFEEQDSERDFDLILKGAAYSYRELIKWGNTMINEQISNQTDISESDVELLKNKLKDN